MYRIVLVCEGVPPHLGQQGAIDIAEEFTHRQWHTNVRCIFEGGALLLQAENDFDSDGLALQDEFSDSISAGIEDAFEGDLRVASVTQFTP